MALACHYYSTNTVRTTQQTANCIATTIGQTAVELDLTQGLLLVLDALQRQSIGTALASTNVCDLEEVWRDAACALGPITTPGEVDANKVLALILYRLNNAGC